MRPPIKDEFTGLRISDQRRHKLRKARDRICLDCTEKALVGSSLCLKHIVARRERERRVHGFRRRFTNAMSYLLQTQYGVKW